MEVMLIFKKVPNHNIPDLRKALNDIQVGNIYNVVDERPTQYELLEFPHPRIILWDKECFATLPGLSADEMAEITREAIIR